MTDAAFILSVLEDGEKHSTNELIAKSQAERGCGLMVHSRVADLRKKDHYIVCEFAGRHKGRPIYEYQLIGSLPTSPQSSPELAHEPHVDSTGSNGSGRGDVESEQPSLFTYPRSPAWG